MLKLFSVTSTTDPELATLTVATFLRTHRVLFDALDRELRDRVGLSIPQWEVLEAIGRSAEGRLRMVDITKRMCVSKSGVTQLVDRLEEKGLVARSFSSSDRRLIYASLTQAGADASRQAWPAFHAAVEAHFTRHLSGADVSCLRRGLTKVLGGSGLPEAVLDDHEEEQVRS